MESRAKNMKKERDLGSVSLVLLVIAFLCWPVPPAAAEKRANTFWVHGTILQPEIPSQFLHNTPPYIYNKGGGAMVVWNGERFFDIPLSTPVVNKQAVAEKLYLLFSTYEGAQLTSIEIWDGEDLIKSIKGQGKLPLSGDYGVVGKENTFEIRKRPRHGLNIRVGVDFGGGDVLPQPPDGKDLKGPRFQLHAAGIRFLRWWGKGIVGGAP
jgi:hypothetical protein